MEQILIIGGVAAGATAAAKVRRLSADAEITLLEAGPDISFANCGLPYFIGGDIENRSSLILQSPESFHAQYNVKVHTNTQAIRIDRDNRRVIALRSGESKETEFTYTRLILAQGGRPITPALPGSESGHVFSLWTLEDMDRIDRYIRDRQPVAAVIAGGGFIGLEMAEALAKRRIQVHIVEKLPHTMAVMDAEIAGFMQEEMMRHGVQLHTGTGLASISSEYVELENGERIAAQMVLMSIGVRPTLRLAQEAGLELGGTGALLVDRFLRTSDPLIYAAGDMVEVEHRVHHGKVRIPLAGPANRQGRIAAENALGGQHAYPGALGTSIVRVFDAVAGVTGLSLKGAQALGLDAEAITVHKEHHTAYYPGAQTVTVRLVYERPTGRILGGQTAGYAGAERRLDVIAMAAATSMTVQELADMDFAYSPPLGTANDVLNMAAFVAGNRLSGFSPALTAEELDEFVRTKNPVIIDVRDSFAFARGHIIGAHSVPLEYLGEVLERLPPDQPVVVYDETGKKGHQALRQILGHADREVYNMSGGFISLQRYTRAHPLIHFQVQLPVLEKKDLHTEAPESATPLPRSDMKASRQGPLVVDVRTPAEFARGAYPDAINIPLDELIDRVEELGPADRELTLYCASGARSGYAVQLLKGLGYTRALNGGGLMQMMRQHS